MIDEDYLAQQQQALVEEQSDDCCFLTNQPEGQFVKSINWYKVEWEYRYSNFYKNVAINLHIQKIIITFAGGKHCEQKDLIPHL